MFLDRLLVFNYLPANLAPGLATLFYLERVMSLAATMIHECVEFCLRLDIILGGVCDLQNTRHATHNTKYGLTQNSMYRFRHEKLSCLLQMLILETGFRYG